MYRCIHNSLILITLCVLFFTTNFFFFSSRRRHTRFDCDWSSDVCSSDLGRLSVPPADLCFRRRALALRPSLGWVREGPPFTLPVCFLRAAFRTPADQTAATGCCFTAFTGLHLLCTGSASADPRRSVLAWAA